MAVKLYRLLSNYGLRAAVLASIAASGILSIAIFDCINILAGCLPALAEEKTQAEGEKQSSTKPLPRSDQNWMSKHERLVKQVSESHAEIAFFGDSITENFNPVLLHSIIGAQASSFGIGGDRTQHLLWRMKNGELNFPSPGPKIFVILIGTNNVSHWPGNPASSNYEIYLGVKADLKELRKHYPESKILLLGILPREEMPQGETRINASETNVLLKKLADQKHVWYADIGKSLLEPDGKISRNVMSDFLHPTEPEGYKRMFSAIKSHLDEMEMGNEKSGDR